MKIQNFSNLNQSNSKNTINFGTVFALKIPKKHYNTKNDCCLSSLDKDGRELFSIMYNFDVFVKKKVIEAGQDPVAMENKIIKMGKEKIYAFFSDSDGALFNEQYKTFEEYKAKIPFYNKIAEELIKEKGEMYKVGENNSIQEVIKKSKKTSTKPN